MASTLGVHNPLRYRGYVYDTETGLYYLQSRYYNPNIGRFLNADGLIATGQGVLGNNMFAYCLNNPLKYVDPNGKIPYSDGFFDEAFQETGRLIYELFTGKDHPDRQTREIERQVIQKQNEHIGNGFKAIGNGFKKGWDAYVHSVELEAQAQYERDMAIRAQWEDTFGNPVKTGDFASMTISNIGTYATYVSFAASPTIGGVVLLVAGIGASIWSTLRYYDVISD